jgi:hypothetical protein
MKEFVILNLCMMAVVLIVTIYVWVKMKKGDI